MVQRVGLLYKAERCARQLVCLAARVSTSKHFRPYGPPGWLSGEVVAPSVPFGFPSPVLSIFVLFLRVERFGEVGCARCDMPRVANSLQRLAGQA